MKFMDPKLFVHPHKEICDKKVPYPTESMARYEAFFALGRRGQPLKALWLYTCPVCFKWHITKNEQADLNLKVTRESVEQ